MSRGIHGWRLLEFLDSFDCIFYRVHVPLLMDLLDDIFSEPPAVKVANRFKPKAKVRPKKGSSKAALSVEVNATEEQPTTTYSPLPRQLDASVPEKTNDVGLSTTTAERPETLAPDVSSIQNEKEIPVFPNVTFASSSPFRPCTSETAHDLYIHQDSEDFQINVEELEAGDFSCLDAAEMINETEVVSGKRISKLKPKPKTKAQGGANNMAETPLCNLSNAPQLSSDDQPVTNVSIHVEGPNSTHDSSQAGLDGTMNPTTGQSQNAVFEDTESLMSPDMLEQRGHHERFDGLNSPGILPEEGPVLSGVETNENTYEFVDETSSGAPLNNNSATKSHDEMASNREEINSDDHLELEKPKKKRGRRTKNATVENDKSARKRKKVSEKPEQPVDKPRKKFPRATRRKRCVDKALLEVPEDELDLHRLPIKDLILLAEHKEREAKKQVTPVPPGETNERTDNLQSEGFPYDDDAMEFEQDGDLSEHPSTSGIKTDTGYYNYHSYRKTQPRAKWSKKDTEMFYQGIRQFGTDLSMIQQLFPGRSLEQIRSKYRKEQKQNPLMMDEAQATRATDNSCFELVIKTLEAAQEYASSDDDFVHSTGKEGKPEDNIETHTTPQEAVKSEAANSEHNLNDKAAGEMPDRPEVGSPVKTYDDDDDWDNYTGL